jgi:diguanylate cyclase (GGDEF)-like protein
MAPSAERLLAIIEIQNAIAAASMSAEDVMRLVAERAPALLGSAGATVELVEGDDLVCRAAGGATKQNLGRRQSAATSAAGRAVSERRAQHDEGALYVPIMHGEYAVGAIGATGAQQTEDDVETLRLIATVVAIPLHRTRSFPRPKKDELHDTVTGLFNRRAFQERITIELARRLRYEQSFSLAILDLDGFNTANDRFGEAAGDELLRNIGAILNKHTRVMDACFRLGGDEFAIVMPGTGLDGAKVLAERFRGYIADEKLCEGTVTASFGVVTAGKETAEALLDRALAELHADKRARRPA